ncbi:hypothetical protein V2J09_016894 [Rumex salicifolius]
MGVIDLKPEVFSNPNKGKKVFNALVQILETQQSQLEALADERKRQEEQIKIEYERWISGVRSLKDVIDQLRRQTKLSEMARLVEAAKTNLVFGLKMKQELVYKLKLDNSEDELADFKEWFDILSHRCPVEKDVSPEKLHDIIEGSGKENGSIKSARTKRVLEKEVKKLKSEYEKLSLKNSSEVSALLSEKEFVWNQFAEMEKKYTAQLKEKNAEVNQANARATKLGESLKQLHSSSMEKDAQIADLKASIAKMEAEASEKDGEVSRMLEELKSLKKSNSELLTPVLRPCSAKPKAIASSSNGEHGRKRKTPSLTRFGTAETKAKALTLDDENVSRRNSRSMKRMSSSQDNNTREKHNRAAFQQTPKLFSSDFKIPKLKHSSLR